MGVLFIFLGDRACDRAEGSCLFRALEKLKQSRSLNFWSLEKGLSMCSKEPRAFLVGALINPPPTHTHTRPRLPQGWEEKGTLFL